MSTSGLFVNDVRVASSESHTSPLYLLFYLVDSPQLSLGLRSFSIHTSLAFLGEDRSMTAP
jgi:hypothetical protein